MQKLLWLDLETTGLDENNDVILECAVIVTDSALREIESFDMVVQQPQEALDKMNDWCKKTHGDSGLIHEVQRSHYTLEALESDLILFTRDHFGGERPKLAGSSIHFDRKFIAKHLPDFDAMLHYRMIDVSSTMESLVIFKGYDFPKSEPAHRAIDDIKASIALQRKLNDKILNANAVRSY